MITYNEFGHAFLVEKRRVSGIFLENLELNHFPFDVQVRDCLALCLKMLDSKQRNLSRVKQINNHFRLYYYHHYYSRPDIFTAPFIGFRYFIPTICCF